MHETGVSNKSPPTAIKFSHQTSDVVLPGKMREVVPGVLWTVMTHQSPPGVRGWYPIGVTVYPSYACN